MPGLARDPGAVLTVVTLRRQQARHARPQSYHGSHAGEPRAGAALRPCPDDVPESLRLAAVRQRRGLRDVPCCWDVCAMDERADIVVAGAGHNSLIAACYLAKAGYRCLVLDARHVPGGGAATEEILLPGYGIDTCATGHTLIRVNPLLTGGRTGADRCSYVLSRGFLSAGLCGDGRHDWSLS